MKDKCSDACSTPHVSFIAQHTAGHMVNSASPAHLTNEYDISVLCDLVDVHVDTVQCPLLAGVQPALLKELQVTMQPGVH